MESEKEPTRLLELEPRLLALFLFIAIPFTLVGALFILGSVRTEINQTIGKHLAEVAVDTASHMDSFILHNITSVSVLAATPELIRAATAANRQYSNDLTLVERLLREKDRDWQDAKGKNALAGEIVGRPVSSFLRRVASVSPAYREIFLTDRYGAVVAATNPTTDYFQADEAWWQQAFAEGESGAIFLGNVRFDPSAGTYALEVAVPVRGPEGETPTEVVGLLKTLVDADDLASVLGSVRMGQSGRAVLVDASDGAVITGEDPGEAPRRSYLGLVQLQEAMAQGRSSFVSRGADGQVWLSGFSRMPEPSPSPELDWYVVVEQLREEAQAPIQTATRHLLTFFGGMVLTVVLFSLYLHFKLVRPIRQVDLREEMDRA